MEVRFVRSRTLLAFLLAFCVRETCTAHSGRPGLRGLPCYALLPSVALSLHIQLDPWTSSLLGLRKGLELRANLRLPRYSLIAHNHVVSEDNLREVLANFRQTLLGEELFTVYWDLREVKLPSRKTIRVGVEWMGEPEHAKALDTKVKGVAVVVKGSVVRTVASWVLSVCKPPCPVCICRTPDDALTFARSIGPAAATTEAEFGRKLS